MIDPSAPLALFMEGSLAGPYGKMGFGVLRYSPNPVVAVVDSTQVGRDANEFGPWRSCPVVASIEEAREKGATVLVLGIAPLGGSIPAEWLPALDRAVELGMTLVNGLHDRLAPRYGADKVWDVREEPAGLNSGTGSAARLLNRRVLLVGTDMAVGKMTAGLEMFRIANERGIDTGFVATGQIGITITGAGIPLDAIRVDFASGAVEREVMRNRDKRLVIVEGQGSLAHPGSTATLPLLRGSMPTHLIMCVRAGQTHLRERLEVRIPHLRPFMRLYEELGEVAGTFRRPITAAVAANTVNWEKNEADDFCRLMEAELGIPVVDPVRHGADRLVDAVLS